MALVPGHDCRVDRGSIARAEEQIDGFPDEIGARASCGGRPLVESGNAGVVELDQRLASRH